MIGNRNSGVKHIRIITARHRNAHVRPVRLESEEAVYLIAFFSQSKKAREFRKWVAGLLKAYRQGKLGSGPAARDHLNRMREQRLFMREQRQFMAAVNSEASLILSGKRRLFGCKGLYRFRNI